MGDIMDGMTAEKQVKEMNVEEIAKAMLGAGALDIRDTDGLLGDKEEPFLYSSGNKGCGYVYVKAMVSLRNLFKNLCFNIALDIWNEYCASYDEDLNIDFVGGNVTGGMIPGWLIAEYLSDFFGREIPFVYIRMSRKKGGHKENITGDSLSPIIKKGSKCIVIEELVNFAETTCQSAEVVRRLGYKCSYAATILSYNHTEALSNLKQHEVQLIYSLTLEQLLTYSVMFEHFNADVVGVYREQLGDPIQWQRNRGIVPETEGTRLKFQIAIAKPEETSDKAGFAQVIMEDYEEQLPILKKLLGV